jgi:hypothetical protein
VRSSAASAGVRVLQLAAASITTAAVVVSVFLTGVAACGTDVNLGGGADGATSPVDAGVEGEMADICEPCSSLQACANGASCVQVAGNLTFCATICPAGNECEPDEICQPMVMHAGGPQTQACAPKVGACAPATPPRSESGVVEHCGTLEGPNTAAACKSCDVDDKDCQKNGCYGGWWCNTKSNKCQKPPEACP